MSDHLSLSKRFPIYHATHMLSVAVEEAVRRFSRYHKYTLGSDLRRLSARCHSAVSHAILRPERRLKMVVRASYWADEIKFTLQRAKDCHAFARFAVFEQLAAAIVDVIRQLTRWHDKLQRHGQN
ncbi:MAG: hypothetical protein HWE20_16405 [Gammaproteobacteria bacterium]|nr:hypothetical protein [Gammaproteobacteria bacterium]